MVHLLHWPRCPLDLGSNRGISGSLGTCWSGVRAEGGGVLYTPQGPGTGLCEQMPCLSRPTPPSLWASTHSLGS